MAEKMARKANDDARNRLAALRAVLTGKRMPEKPVAPPNPNQEPMPERLMGMGKGRIPGERSQAGMEASRDQQGQPEDVQEEWQQQDTAAQEVPTHAPTAAEQKPSAPVEREPTPETETPPAMPDAPVIPSSQTAPAMPEQMIVPEEAPVRRYNRADINAIRIQAYADYQAAQKAYQEAPEGPEKDELARQRNELFDLHIKATNLKPGDPVETAPPKKPRRGPRVKVPYADFIKYNSYMRGFLQNHPDFQVEDAPPGSSQAAPAQEEATAPRMPEGVQVPSGVAAATSQGDGQSSIPFGIPVAEIAPPIPETGAPRMPEGVQVPPEAAAQAPPQVAAPSMPGAGGSNGAPAGKPRMPERGVGGWGGGLGWPSAQMPELPSSEFLIDPNTLSRHRSKMPGYFDDLMQTMFPSAFGGGDGGGGERGGGAQRREESSELVKAMRELTEEMRKTREASEKRAGVSTPSDAKANPLDASDKPTAKTKQEGQPKAVQQGMMAVARMLGRL